MLGNHALEEIWRYRREGQLSAVADTDVEVIARHLPGMGERLASVLDSGDQRIRVRENVLFIHSPRMLRRSRGIRSCRNVELAREHVPLEDLRPNRDVEGLRSAPDVFDDETGPRERRALEDRILPGETAGARSDHSHRECAEEFASSHTPSYESLTDIYSLKLNRGLSLGSPSLSSRRTTGIGGVLGGAHDGTPSLTRSYRRFVQIGHRNVIFIELFIFRMAVDESNLNKEFAILTAFGGLDLLNAYFAIYEILSDWVVGLILSIVIITSVSAFAKIMDRCSNRYDWDSF